MRVLKPGGNLILADLIFDTTKYFGDLIVPENIVKNQDIELNKLRDDNQFPVAHFTKTICVNDVCHGKFDLEARDEPKL
jgi:hypothetical protein